MVLRKRYRRDIRHNLSLYVSATVLTVLSLLLFYLYDIAGEGILRYADDIFESQKIEDANFSTYRDIPQEEMAEFEKKYDLVMEKQHYLNLETDGVTARIFEKSEKIDLHYVTEGRDVKADDEIIFSEGYAQNAGIALGDSVKIRDKHYTVVGYVERPDYLFMLQNPGDADKNIASFFIGYMTDDAFGALGESLSHYMVRYRQDNSSAFRRELNDRYVMRSYVAAEDNLRITMMTAQPRLFITMAYFILFILPLLAVMLISIILSRKIRSEQKMIGTLAACGYTKGQICRYYAGFSAIPGLLGGVLTTAVVALCAKPYGSMGLMDYEPLDVEFSLPPVSMLLGILLPTLLYVLSTVLTVRKLLKNDIAVLLAGAAKGKSRIRKSLVKRKVPLRLKLCLRSILGNPGRTCVLFFGTFLGSFVVLWALGCLDTAHNITTSTMENMGDYNYQYVLGELNKENPYGGETMMAASLEDKSGRTLSLFGADDNSLVGLRDEADRPVPVDDGYLITSLYAMVGEVKAGDIITVSNPLTTEEYKIRISGIVKNDYAKAIYTSRKNVSAMSGVDESLYNVILSREKLAIPEKKLVTTISRDTIAGQYEAAIAQMNTIIHLFAGVGVILCIIAVYIAVNMTITENRKNISMLGILGYDKKRIHRLLLRDNILVVIPAILLSIPATLYASKALFYSFADILGYVMEVYIKPSTFVVSILLVLAGYYLSMALVSRKITKVDMAESLKENRD